METLKNFGAFVLLIFFMVHNTSVNCQVLAPTYANVSYGDDPAQIVDYYIAPNNSLTSVTHVVILIHGGAWGGGSKSDMSPFVPFILSAFPGYLVANMEYRLGTWSSPGYPKQTEDIGAVISFIKSKLPGQKLTFALFGGSAGAHLSLLYGYRYDAINRDVSVVIDVVGPADFTDPAYAWNLVYNWIFFAFIGPNFYFLNPGIYNETSPLTWATPNSPKTIGFYGDKDPLVPNSQHKILGDKLNNLGVVNEVTVYSGGHFDWSPTDVQDMKDKIVVFLAKYF